MNINIRSLIAILFILSVTSWNVTSHVEAGEKLIDHYPEAKNSGCMKCHAEIELIREPGSEMLEQIMQQGKELGDPAGCVVCHGGDPKATEKEAAHVGDKFYADPGSPWINENTCGKCHPQHCEVQWRSLMMTEAGKIQGVCWSFGSLTGYEHLWANYAVENPKDPNARLGSDVYRKYMERLKRMEPNVFVDRHEPLPEAPTDLSKLKEDPTLAAFTYIRQECQRCHHAVKGRQKRGDYRGMGCSSCHVPYSNEGFYEGDDKTINRDEPGHALVHSIQGTREAKVTVHDKTYSGIPVETCTTCHDRGKRIGVSFQGLMETAYNAPFAADGSDQPALHSKHYIAMQQDVHYLKGMTCQDCHTSTDVHGDGFLAGANLAAVQIECADCHGTPDVFPWDLPLGYMDEFEETPATGAARGLTKELTPHTLQGTIYDPEDGYLLTARGNAYGNVVKKGEDIIVHTANGKDLIMKPLKTLKAHGEISDRGIVAMSTISRHMDRMECYTCHATWAPQCFGCHVKIDYSREDECPEQDTNAKPDAQTKAVAAALRKVKNENFDWVAAGRKHMDPRHAADRGESSYDMMIPGKISETRSYLRWENPMLGVNGEGRITPLAPGCQPAITIIGEDGEPILVNHVFRTMPGAEGGGDEGQLALDMSPVQPHTMTKNARKCESCHASDKALGYGIDGARDLRRLDETIIVDLETIDGDILPKRTRPQFEKIEHMSTDWSRIVSEDGKQLMTVGHHFKLSRPLNNKERALMNRGGTCAACHQELPKGNLATSLLHHVAKYTGQLPDEPHKHASLVHKILLLAAWVQVAAMMMIPFVIYGCVRWYRRRKIRKLRRLRKAQALAENPTDSSESTDTLES
ncbi:MAG: hypothetical protein JKY95_10965 [Planctomycetaceae bacterium]|nr:hypothetical protein [Planctomycetaceae bacterium]